MKMAFNAFYVSMIIQFVRKVIRRLSGLDIWTDVTGWTKLILSKDEANELGIDGYDVFTYCKDDGLYHGWLFDGDEYVKVTARDMKPDPTSLEFVKNRRTGVLERARPVQLQFV